MRQAIVTKYHGPTNTRGARVSAKARAGKVWVSWEDALDVEGNHKAAAFALARRYEWFGSWVGGANPDGTGNTYCMREFKSSNQREQYRRNEQIDIE